jgi:hypothetical protein
MSPAAFLSLNFQEVSGVVLYRLYHINIKHGQNYITGFIKYLILLSQMKKLIVAILAILYMGSTTGATIHMHYCMGKLVDKGLWHGKAKKCSLCKKQDKKKSCSKSCCKDSHKFIKLEKDQKTGETAFQFVQQVAVLYSNHFAEVFQPFTVSLTQAYPVSNGPPPGKVHSYILHCTFRI